MEVHGRGRRQSPSRLKARIEWEVARARLGQTPGDPQVRRAGARERAAVSEQNRAHGYADLTPGGDFVRVASQSLPTAKIVVAMCDFVRPEARWRCGGRRARRERGALLRRQRPPDRQRPPGRQRHPRDRRRANDRAEPPSPSPRAGV